jgi:16S rRNA processing protein RimM
VSSARPKRGADSAFLLVGHIRKPHGIRGELFVWPETDRPEVAFQDERTLFLGDDEGPSGDATLTVDRARPFKDGYLLKAKEHTTRTEALEALRGRSLYIRRAEAAPLADDEVYYHDLIGLRVLVGGEEVGRIREVYEGPGTDLLAVARTGRPELLVPFVADIVRRVDVEAGEVEIEPPQGLLEL